jgi:hypothetical protein
MLGVGGTANFQPGLDFIHEQKITFGSWVMSIWRMESLVERTASARI